MAQPGATMLPQKAGGSMVLPARAIELGLHVIYGDNGRARIVADTRKVADAFGKQHGHVLRDIEKSLLIAPNLEGLNWFRQTVYIDDRGRSQPCYDLTRDGFMWLATSYDDAIKLRYMLAFNEMEEELGREQPDFVDHLKRQLDDKFGAGQIPLKEAADAILDQTRQKNKFSKEAKAEIRKTCASHPLLGRCACGCGLRIMRAGVPIKDKPEDGEDYYHLDHFNRESATVEDGFPVARSCNLKMRNQQYRLSKRDAFITFHTNRRMMRQPMPAALPEPEPVQYSAEPLLFDALPKQRRSH